MKTLLPLSFIAAIFAFLIFPLSFEVAMSLLVGAGFATIAFSDYSRTSRVLPVATAAGHAIARRERFGLAA
jgi:hypothetical protein